ncbi:MAG: hypothetical protein JJU28_05790 [Cyclobacteriaceae bacterium]|nr:hypothetical protein [Cyclobacteriaceae bacterium]
MEPLLLSTTEVVEKDLSEADKRQIALEIRELMFSDSLIDPGFGGPVLLHSRRSFLLNKYHLSDFQPLWLNGKNVNDACFVLEESAWDGLWPFEYQLDLICRLTRELDRENVDYRKYAIRDILLSEAIMTLVRHLEEGKTDPVLFENSWNYPLYSFSDDKAFDLLNAL